MAEGAERFRGLWEDEMFARQDLLGDSTGTELSPPPKRRFEFRSSVNSFRLPAPGRADRGTEQFGAQL